MRRSPVIGSVVFDRMSNATRFRFGFDLYAHHVIFLFGTLMISKLAFEKKKNQILEQEEIHRSIAKENFEYLERNKIMGSGHVRTRRGYYVTDDDVEVVVV